MDSSVIGSTQGILGIRPYIPPSKELYNFTMTWRRNFSQDNPNVDISKLNVFGIWAYDTVWALAKAIESVGAVNFNTTKPDTRKNLISLEAVAISQTGSKLLKAILQSKCKVLSGEFQFIDGKMPSPAFKIINVIDLGVAMMVPKENEKRNMRFFLKPLHVDLWINSGAFFIFMGLCSLDY
ncbi:hypothetical protein HHK36_021142 [Tetracentron sinense]|uniref:Receptor ligand binding region domain-containing protein n=1 Tax=Tetracentron sinense TaxID=13715 RepID=A0A834YWB1_TETSI|nr:hypothetical protein HHK36_021142 [Tetracentron sinense]